MNRAQRREVKRQVAKTLKGRGSLKHPVPESVTLSGGPMDGWVVTPTAPVLDPDWRAKFIEMEAAKLYLQECENRGLQEAPLWSGIPDNLRAPFREAAKEMHGDGRYEREASTFPPRAHWITA